MKTKEQKYKEIIEEQAKEIATLSKYSIRTCFKLHAADEEIAKLNAILANHKLYEDYESTIDTLRASNKKMLKLLQDLAHCGGIHELDQEDRLREIRTVIAEVTEN